MKSDSTVEIERFVQLFLFQSYARGLNYRYARSFEVRLPVGSSRLHLHVQLLAVSPLD